MQAVVEQAIQCVLSLFLIGLTGYVLDKKGWFAPETKTLFPKLVTIITLPPYLFYNISKTFSRDELAGLIHGALVPVLSMGTAFLLAWGLAKAIKVPAGRSGLFKAGFATSNTIFIGLPVNVALFGDQALPYVLLYFFVNTTFFWTIGNYLLSLDGSRQPEKVLIRATVKRIFSPPLLGFMLGVTLVMSELRPPLFIMDAAYYLGSLTTPLAILFIGISMASMKFKELRVDKDVLGILAGRFIVSPLAVIMFSGLMDLPPLMVKVFIIQSSLPVISSAVLLAGYHGSDIKFASVAVSLSTLLSVVTIPVYMIIISLLMG